MFAIIVVVPAKDETGGEEVKEFLCGLFTKGVLVAVADAWADGTPFAQGSAPTAVRAVEGDVGEEDCGILAVVLLESGHKLQRTVSNGLPALIGLALSQSL
jgi:hypothetical protein